MCGIFFCIKYGKGCSLDFKFNILELYKLGVNQKYALKTESSDYLEYLAKNNLFLEDFRVLDVYNSISNRGPDSFRCIRLTLHQSDGNIKYSSTELSIDDKNSENFIFSSKESDDIEIICCSSVLNLRGNKDIPTVQPLMHEKTSNILMFNGEIFNVELEILNLVEENQKFGELFETLENFDPYSNDTIQLFDLLNLVSLYYFKNKEETEYSELIENVFKCLNADYSFVFVDILNKKIIFGRDNFGKRSLLMGLTKNGICISSCSIIGSHQPEKTIEDNTDEENEESKLTEFEKSDDIEQDEKKMQNFLEKKYNNEFLMAMNKYWVEIPTEKSYELNLSTPNIMMTYNHMKNLVIEENKIEEISEMKLAIDTTKEYLISSHKNIIQNIFCFKDSFRNTGDSEHKLEENTSSELSILFSGGLDSSLITLISGLLLPQNSKIDLLNIAFKDDAPDRETGIKSYLELRGLLPNIQLNLVLIDKSLNHTKEINSKIIDLIYPKNTHMDFNISAALHLASQGEGILYENKLPYKSPAKIILSGLGADEIFGGYSRYRVAFLRGGFSELHNEMNFDLQRLWIRNLGRDDRSISSNGKEVRFPFLNTNLITHVKKIKRELLTDFNMPKGTGDKVLLRKIAEDLGLKLSHKFKKRAIQFGTRLAKLSNIDSFGSNRKAKGNAAYKSQTK